MKSKAKVKVKVSNFPREILQMISLEVEQEIRDELSKLDASLEVMTLSDMEKEVISIRNKIGIIFMQKVFEAREKIGKKKLLNS